MKRSLLLVCTLLILVNARQLYSQSTWFWQQPQPTGNLLYDVKFLNSQTGYAVGKLGTIMKTTNAGVNWELQNSNTTNDLQDVDFVNANTAVAVGANGLVLRTTNGGANWYTAANLTGFTLFQVDFPTTTTGYAAGGAGLIFKTTNAGINWTQQTTGTSRGFICINFYNENIGAAGGGEILELTTDGGNTWNIQNVFFDTFDQMSGIAQTDSLTVIGACNSINGSMYKTTNGGINWTITSLGIPLDSGNVNLVRDMSFGNANTGYIACDLGTIMITTNAGNYWRRDTTFNRKYFNIGFFWGVNTLESGIADVVGGGGTVIRTTNNGINWFATSGGKYDLNANYFTDVNAGYSVGVLGNILKTTDAGNTWLRQTSNTLQNLNDVHFVNSDVGYVCGDTGTILKTINGGSNWISQTSGVTNNLNGIFFTDGSTGTAVGSNGRILRTTNGGNNWESQTSNTVDILNSLFFLNRDTGFVVGEGSLDKTTNGGQNWNVQSGGTFDIQFTDASTGYRTSGSGDIRKTTNGGINWFAQNSNVSGNLLSISFINNNNGIAVGGSGDITKTTNGGQNWIAQPLMTTNILTSVFMVNSNTGYITGEFGTLLKTTNAGLTFIVREQEIIPTDYLLYQNYPNPFNSSTIIKYEIKKNGFVEMKIYDVNGKEISKIVSENQSRGSYKILYNGSDLASGVYFYSLYINNQEIKTNKFLLIK